MKIGFLGDFFPTSTSGSIEISDDLLTDYKKSTILSILKNNNFNIVNLECPITNSNNLILKSGPSVKASYDSIELLNIGNIKVASLANNHIKDFQPDIIIHAAALKHVSISEDNCENIEQIYEVDWNDYVAEKKSNEVLQRITGTGPHKYFKMNKQKLPLRDGVGVIILNNKNQVFVGKRKDNPIDKWQMPQGGVDKGEDFLEAMKRELSEETSIKTIEILAELDGFFDYELPSELIGIIWKGKFRGQKQKWFIAKFLGDEKEINLNTKNPEFVEWKWIDPNFLPEVIVDFKKNLYLKLLKEIKKFIS